MQIKSSYLYIPVSDLYKSANWYKEHLGFEIVVEDPIYLELRTESGVRVMLIPNEDQVKSHMNYSNGPQASYGFIVSDIGVMYKELKEKGIQVNRISEYAGTSFGFHDPDGNILELWSDYPSA
ncbi:VOC family protein [Paenibacillus solisilvae]|uniref:VOC family protein n=1 Tax=Paenibacillus solisilvae TaxID=2486751 RepID=A0ABW0W1Z6_9BACL